MKMTNQQLLLNLQHHLRRYDDAVVLYVCLQQAADVSEFKTTATQIAFDRLEGHLGKKQVQRSLERLAAIGVVEMRVHANYRTHISVDRHAVLTLLHQSISAYLPGLRDEAIPLLDALEEEALGNYVHDARHVINKVTRPAEPDATKPDQLGST